MSECNKFAFVRVRLCLSVSLVLALSSVQAANSQSLAGAAAAARLKDLMDDSATFRADFVQRTIDADGRTLSESRGNVLAQQPQQLRWEISAPAPQFLITNGQDVWFYDPDLEQVTLSKLDQHISDAPLLIFANDTQRLLDRYEIKAEQSDERWIFILAQKNAQANQGMDFAQLSVEFNQRQLTSMSILDNLQRLTEVRFQGVEHPQTLAAALFDFEVPANVEIIRR